MGWRWDGVDELSFGGIISIVGEVEKADVVRDLSSFGRMVMRILGSGTEVTDA
jgi:hypothetical protein